MVSSSTGEEAMKTIRCRCCRKIVPANPHLKNQQFCSDPDCQRERKRLWQKEKLRSDPDYRANQADSQKHWRETHTGYWRQWRQSHEGYVQGNREKTRLRRFAKMDTVKPEKPIIPGSYYLISCSSGTAAFAKMDASHQKVIIIPTG